jgi:L-iditol 2-dehydrogenase
MKTARFTGPRKIEIADLPAPKLQSPGDVLLRVERLGVCGSDVHYYLDGRIGDKVLTYPATLGHECAGTVAETGEAATGLRQGERVAVDPAIACDRCDQCLSGRPNTCRRLQFLGSPDEAPGAAAEYLVVPGRNCFPIPAAMTLDEAVLVEPLSVGLHAVRLAGLAEGGGHPIPRPTNLRPAPGEGTSETVPLRPPVRDPKLAVFGVGPIGLGVLLCAKALGPCTALATDLVDRRLAVAERCGADWTGNAGAGDVCAALLRQAPEGVDVAFECSGDPACLDQAVEVLSPGGTLVLAGIPAPDRVSFDIHTMRRKELRLSNVRRQCGCVGPVIEMIGAGRLDARPLLTHRFPLETIGDAFELVAGRGDGVVKAVIELSCR